MGPQSESANIDKAKQAEKLFQSIQQKKDGWSDSLLELEKLASDKPEAQYFCFLHYKKTQADKAQEFLKKAAENGHQEAREMWSINVINQKNQSDHQTVFEHCLESLGVTLEQVKENGFTLPRSSKVMMHYQILTSLLSANTKIL